MNYDGQSPSPSTSDANGDHQTQDEARTTDRLSAASTVPTEADDGAAATDWCAWCGRGPSTDEDFGVDETWPSAADDDDDDRRRRPSYDQLRFCSRSCVSRYKMDLFCRETQRYLQQLQVPVAHIFCPSPAHVGEMTSFINFFPRAIVIKRKFC